MITKSTFALLVCLSATTLHATPTVIRADFQPATSFDGRPPVNFTGVESKAAAADPVFGSNGTNTWNHLSVNDAGTNGGAPPVPLTVNPSFPNLLDSTGATTSVTLSFTGTVSGGDDSPTDSSGSDGLENDYFLINYLQQGMTIAKSVNYTLSGLPANTTVALFFYVPNFAHADSSNPNDNGDRGFILTANGQTINVNSGTYNNALAYVTTDANGAISGTWTTAGNEGDWSGMQLAYPASQTPAPSTFFNGANNLGSSTYYLAFPGGNIFGYYAVLTDPHYIYHFDLGYEYAFDAADGKSGVYLYDFTSNDFFYTSPTFSFPYLYDFNLQAVLYYYPDPNNPQRYNTNGVRYFYNFSTGQIITQ